MLTQPDRDQLASKLFELALFYGKNDLSREAISATINLYESFFGNNLFEYLAAINAYMNDSKNTTYPHPSKLRPYLTHDLDDDSKSVEVASRVVAAISKFGWPNGDQAKVFIGDLGWEAVRRFGGWSYVCENLGTEISITTFQAQVRDAARSIIKSVKVGSYDQAISLPGSPSPTVSLINIKIIPT